MGQPGEGNVYAVAIGETRIMPRSFVVCEEPDTPQERVAIVVWWLAHGEALTTRQVAEMTGLGERGARVLMIGISRVLPLRLWEGKWEVMAAGELDC